MTTKARYRQRNKSIDLLCFLLKTERHERQLSNIIKKKSGTIKLTRIALSTLGSDIKYKNKVLSLTVGEILKEPEVKIKRLAVNCNK